jgi:hypothetical protein
MSASVFRWVLYQPWDLVKAPLVQPDSIIHPTPSMGQDEKIGRLCLSQDVLICFGSPRFVIAERIKPNLTSEKGSELSSSFGSEIRVTGVSFVHR